jgi:hypothetical protein
LNLGEHAPDSSHRSNTDNDHAAHQSQRHRLWPPAGADLDVAENFSRGMKRADRTATALYMRGTDQHRIHVTEKGEPKFVGLAVRERR